METLQHLFAAVCGQNPDHTWAPGGILLPICQRCTGLYAGAAAAALLHVLARPRLSSRRLELHGAFLLLMVPSGLNWLPQGPVLRAVTGVLFGSGVFTFLWLPASRLLTPPQPLPQDQKASTRRWLAYLGALAATLFFVSWVGTRGGLLAAYVLMALSGTGAFALSVLVLANIGLGVAEAARAANQLTRTLRRS